MDRQQYFADYHKNNYVSNTSKRDNKAHTTMGKLLVVVAYHANLDGGDKFSVAKVTEEFVSKYELSYLKNLLKEKWSDAVIFEQNLLSRVLECSQRSISNYIAKAVEQGYLLGLGKYQLEGSTYGSGVYMVNIEKIKNDFQDIWFEWYQELGNKYYELITDKKENDSIKLNNECMKSKVFREISEDVAEFYKHTPDKFKTHFLELENDGNYSYGRYYSDFCHTKNPEKHPDILDRQEFLTEWFGDIEVEEYDVNSMMYRSSYDLIHEKYLSPEQDVYYELYKDMVDSPADITYFKKYLREYLKKNIMSVYMDPRSVYCKSRKNAKNLEELNLLEEKYTQAEIVELEQLFGLQYEEFLTRLKEALYKFLSVYDFDGDKRVFFGRMYFKYEAIILHYMRKLFSERGIKTLNVYDGFYFEKGVCNNELFYEVYHKAIDMTKELFKKYNYNLVALYGKKFEVRKRYTKKYNKQPSYMIPTDTVVEKVSDVEHNNRRNSKQANVKQKALELEAKGIKAVF